MAIHGEERNRHIETKYSNFDGITPDGELYICAQDIFNKTYDFV